MKKSCAKKIARLESIVIGAGLLLSKLQADYGHDFGIGMAKQVRDCIRDSRAVAHSASQREQAAKAPGSAA